MAKIYETKEDFQRDQLKEQVQTLRQRSLLESASGASLTSLSFFTLYLNKIRPSEWKSFITIALLGAGLYESIASWVTGSQIGKIEAELKKLGPETIVLPPENGIPEKMFGVKITRHTNPAKAASYTEKAEQSSGFPVGKG